MNKQISYVFTCATGGLLLSCGMSLVETGKDNGYYLTQGLTAMIVGASCLLNGLYHLIKDNCCEDDLPVSHSHGVSAVGPAP